MGDEKLLQDGLMVYAGLVGQQWEMVTETEIKPRSSDT